MNKSVWNNIRDGEPKEDGKYLCVCTYCFTVKHMRILSYAKNLQKVDKCDFYGCNHSGWYFYDSEYGYCEAYSVTHWMPLPELPGDGE